MVWKVSPLFALLSVACSSPAPAELSLSLLSERGLIDAEVQVVAPVQRGGNQLRVELRSHLGEGEASLEAVNATMAAHGHEATAGAIEPTSSGYVVRDLGLFMSGRWEVELEVALDGQRDTLSLPVDVP